jgi:hypothetical protein
MGRSFIRAALNSARGVLPHDNSPQAAAARRIAGLGELDGLEFIARVDIEKDGKGMDRNVVKLAVEPDHPEYAAHKGSPAFTPARSLAGAAVSASSTPPVAGHAVTPASRPSAPVSGKPAWAQ